ncbi:hypothetical protein HW115_17705 [Verrucomicrobiaceae bacterium N1E253]|uniref:SLA1 homology domain-containing protein n=1 Tax=Oceaniferula marina TaxID=2748318 RepID=A0A851GR40_9BACT|nr:hypothetical protein [Oceaniferula marina]NWK57457.1 hypothetical protein [Oceaniferula marina]
MNIHSTITAITLALTVASAQARTWTSADGAKTFEGEYVSHTDLSVTVIKNGRKVTFKQDLISEADRTWIKEEAKKAAEATEESTSLDDQVIGKKIKGKTVRTGDKKFITEDTTKVPQYYFLYFSASW